MYGKLFSSMYDGSIYGRWEAIVTFQQLIILADKDGTVEMTPHALAARTSIPLKILNKGLEILESPDPSSRTPDEGGRRIIRIEPTRAWGWHITNYAKYRAIRTADDRREYHKQYWHKRKNKLPKGYLEDKNAKAHNAVATAINNGKLIPQNCEICGKGKVEAHHDDYNKPLEVRWLCKSHHKLLHNFESQQLNPNQPIVKVKVEAKVEEKIKTSVFKKPSVEEVKQYCQERKNIIDPQSFVDHYEANGWIRGKTKIKDWKACIRTWEKNTKDWPSHNEKYGQGGI